MGWFWRDDDESNHSNSFDMAEFQNPDPSSGSGHRCSTRRIVQSKCHTEEVEPGKFVRKCEKTDQLLRECLGKPTEIVTSNKEYTEEDVTDEVMKGSTLVGSSDAHPFQFPGLRSDIEGIERRFRGDIEAFERNVFGGINRFFEAADEMRNGFFRMLDDPSLFHKDSSSPSRREVIPFEGKIQKKPDADADKTESGSLDLPSLARDV